MIELEQTKKTADKKIRAFALERGDKSSPPITRSEFFTNLKKVSKRVSLSGKE
jgi:hypothetical protein